MDGQLIGAVVAFKSPGSPANKLELKTAGACNNADFCCVEQGTRPRIWGPRPR